MAHNLNLSAFKYPLGFIRIIEFIFIVIAIAAVNSWGVTVQYRCPGTTPNATTTNIQGVGTFSLPKVHLNSCNSTQLHLWGPEDGAAGSAGFFYFVNVTALIYVLFVSFTYVILWQLYQSDKRIALADLGITAVFFVLFFFCSSIWWAGANTIGQSTSEEHLKQLFLESPEWKAQNSTFSSRSVNNGKLAISVLCDWVNVLCFAFNIWFIWKEVVPRAANDPNTIA